MLKNRIQQPKKQAIAKPLVASECNGVFCTLEELVSLKSKAEKLRFPLQHKSRSHLSGGKRSSLRGRGLDFEEVRAYQAGDEIRSIDWKVTERAPATKTTAKYRISSTTIRPSWTENI